MSLLALLLACTSINNGNSTVTGNARPVDLGNPFVPSGGGAGGGAFGDDAGGDAGGGAGGDDTGAEDTGSDVDTDGGSGGDGTYSGALSVTLTLDGQSFPCEGGTASFEVSGGSVTGAGVCNLEGYDLSYYFEGTSGDGGVSGTADMTYSGFEECGYTDGSSMAGTITSGGTVSFSGTYDMVDCGGSAFTFEGAVALD